MVLGDLDKYMQKNKTRPPTYTIHQNKLRMDKKFKWSHNTITVLEGNIGRKIQVLHAAIFSSIYPLEQKAERKDYTYGTSSN